MPCYITGAGFPHATEPRGPARPSEDLGFTACMPVTCLCSRVGRQRMEHPAAAPVERLHPRRTQAVPLRSLVSALLQHIRGAGRETDAQVGAEFLEVRTGSSSPADPLITSVMQIGSSDMIRRM